MATKTREQKDAIALLKRDHEKVRGLLRELEKAAANESGEAEALLKSVMAELRVHTAIEEEIFYPTFRDAANKKDDVTLYYEAVEEHHVVDLVIPEFDKGEPGTPEFAAKAKVLKDLIEHHAEEEENEMFPRARKLMDADELVALGQELAERKRELQGDDTGQGESEE